ncbi:Protein kinase C-binding protein NELL2 [Armadillidium vulgare]|nr:Protein kinase C-binding protein NELL2 [Armadillidium vulgare]
MEISYDQQDAPNQTSSALTEGSSTMALFLVIKQTKEYLSSRVPRVTRVTCSHITSTEARLAAIEECDCQKSCKVNETIRQDGASWKIGCEICSCREQGEVTCRPVPCPNLLCKNPVYTEGECCPLCLKQCSLKGVVYDHGERVSPRQCVDCECRDGKMQCRRIDPETACPELPCPPSEQFSVPGQCCKFCSGIDYCSKGNSCHQNASCINLQTTYACHCNQGFTGDGYNCQDGFVRYDDYSCLEHNECKSGEHGCHENSYCVNTRGSYICVCKEGYQGNGTTCKPVCKSQCRNGGVCSDPDVCTCRLGYTGESCEIDVDECALELHHCPKNSVCINLPGWYMCQCGQGYSSLLSHNSDSKFCQDIDECKLGTSTCHKTATCVNTDGSFECHCENSTNCSLNCISEGKEYENGDVWAPENAKCSQCLCSNGKVTCDRFICDCTSPHVDPICCPQCNLKSFCHHPSYPGRTYTSGQKWIHQCETCECFV